MTIVSHYKLNNTLNDECAGARHLTGVGSPGYTTGKISQGIAITGGDHATYSGSLPIASGANPFTVSAWVKITDIAGDVVFLTFGGLGALEVSIGSAFTECVLHETLIDIGDIVTGAGWHHLVFVFDGTNFLAYLDNTLIDTQPAALAADLGVTDLGRTNSSAAVGVIDNVMVFNDAKNATYIGQLWNSGNGTETVPSEATVPDAPTCSALTAGNGTLSGTITPGASDGGAALIDYKVYNAAGDVLLETVAADGVNPVPFTADGLNNGTTYTIYVKARNSEGESAASATRSGTPYVPTPPGVRLGLGIGIGL